MYNNLIWQKSIFTPPESTKFNESLPKALADVVSQWPDSPAVISEGKIYSFHDLASRVAGLSEEINELGHHPGPVAIIQKVGLDAIAAWFACSLSGRPFLLLEPDHPPARLVELIKTSGCTLALLDVSTSHILLNLPEVIQIISKGRSGVLQQDKGLHAQDPAIIFPTSGSTGNPKLITYATTTIQVKVQSSIQLMRVPQGARVLIAGSHSNYGFLHHALVFLLSGGTVCLTDVKASGFDGILHAITNLGVRHVRFTPSLFRKLAVVPKAQKALRLLDAVRFSGEPLLENDLKLAQSVLNPGCLIQNVYGSTESALFIWSSIDDNQLDANPTVPIGQIYPLSAYAIRPLEDDDKDNPTGELLIRSRFHAIGDLKGGIVNKERFPMLDESTDERIYATGDIVHQLPNGNLIHLGRMGRMVKIRGNRVFLTEVEQQLRTITGVTGAAVVDRVEHDNVVLYGFITTDDTALTSDDLRSQLSARLPDFMIPRSIETINQIPLMAGGKVDYHALATLVSTPGSSTNSEANQANYTRLTQVWDSILWKGAHKYHSDFFALGGDSLSFMTLLVEVEENFGKSIRPEELATNCSLETLATMLGIDRPTSQPIIKYKSLQARLLWQSSLYPSKGIALAMPGYGGLPNAYPFHRASFFPDHDIWAVEFPIEEGNLLQANRWWIAALAIVQGIREGIIPAPRVIFGFSFSGGLAWLVGRLLAGSPLCPEFVVMVDAPPLHRRRRLRHRALKKALKSVSTIQMPPVLHIRRAPEGIAELLRGNEQGWNPNDNIQKFADLPTVDHLDMINWEMLALAKDAVVAFLNTKENNFQWRSVISPPDLLGCHIFYAYHGNRNSLQKVKDELTYVTNKFGQGYLVHLAISTYLSNDIDQSDELIRFAQKNYPDSAILHFLNRRLIRDTNLVFSADIPKIYPVSIISVEYKLAASKQILVRPKPRPIRLLCLAYDAAAALLASKCIRWKHLALSQIRR